MKGKNVQNKQNGKRRLSNYRENFSTTAFVKRRKRGEPPSNMSDDADEDVSFDQEDVNYVAEINPSYSFLYKTKKRLLAHEKEGDDEEQVYEKRPRTYKNTANAKSAKQEEEIDSTQVRHLLPIKKDGKLIQQSILEKIPDESEVDEDEINDVSNVGSIQKNEENTEVTFSSIEEAKQRIGAICITVVGNPENNLKKLKELQRWLKGKHDAVILQLLMISVQEIYKDIVPSYRIRHTTDKEKDQQAKKETIEVREYEEAIVKHYKAYLQTLEKFATDGTSHGVQLTAMRCLCSIMIHLRHFNYVSNIITFVVPFMASQNAKMADIVCDALKELFVEDKAHEATLEVVKAINKLVKSKSYQVPDKVIDTFLSLPIREVDTEGSKEQDSRKKKYMNHKEKLKKLSRNERKKGKHMEKLEKELEAAQAVESGKKKLKMSTDIITQVFTTYFRVLKKAPKSPLLSSVLHGLSKFSHCINIDFYGDLLSTLHDLLSGDHVKLSVLQSLHCIHTVFIILSGYGEAIMLDPHRFYVRLYEVMPRISGKEELVMLLRCLDLMLLKRRKQVSIARVLSFTKRLSVLGAQQSETNMCLAVLAFIRQTMLAFPKCDILLDTDNEGSGLYMPDINDPDHTNAHNTALYELFQLKDHRSVSIRQYSAHIVKGCPIQGNGQLPQQFKNKTPFDILHGSSGEIR